MRFSTHRGGKGAFAILGGEERAIPYTLLKRPGGFLLLGLWGTRLLFNSGWEGLINLSKNGKNQFHRRRRGNSSMVRDKFHLKLLTYNGEKTCLSAGKERENHIPKTKKGERKGRSFLSFKSEGEPTNPILEMGVFSTGVGREKSR